MGAVFSLIAAVFKALGAFLAMRRDEQLVEHGRNAAAVDAIKEVERREEAADRAVAVPDAERDERLRTRFDRSRQ